MIHVTAQTAIPEGELTFTFDRSSGPGGQNVNKLNTRVTLRFDIAGSRALTMEQRERLLAVLRSRLDRGTCLRLSCESHRTQRANRREVLDRFVELLRTALRRPRKRRKTGVPPGAREKRLREKKRRGVVKRERRRPMGDE